MSIREIKSAFLINFPDLMCLSTATISKMIKERLRMSNRVVSTRNYRVLKVDRGLHVAQFALDAEEN